MSEADRLIDQLRRAHDGDVWHGSPLRAILAGITHEEAARHPGGGVHSIWELVLHVTGWRQEVAHRVNGQPAGEPAAGDWPAVGEPTAARWQAALAALDAAHRELVETVRDLSDDELLKPTIDPRNQPPGPGVSRYELLHGIVQHDAYHAGQIALVKKILQSR